LRLASGCGSKEESRHIFQRQHILFLGNTNIAACYHFYPICFEDLLRNRVLSTNKNMVTGSIFAKPTGGICAVLAYFPMSASAQTARFRLNIKRQKSTREFFMFSPKIKISGAMKKRKYCYV